MCDTMCLLVPIYTLAATQVTQATQATQATQGRQRTTHVARGTVHA